MTYLAVALALAAPPEPGTPLFNGTDLAGWVAEGTTTYKVGDKSFDVWTARDGAIACAGKGFGFLRYDARRFGDFSLRVEYRLLPEPGKKGVGNSGLGVRTVKFDPKKSTATRPSYAGYEIQLLDDAGKKPDKHGSGSLYRYVAPTANAVKPAPEWNAVEVTCVGPKIAIDFNGVRVLEADQSAVDEIKGKPLEGYVSLQNHGTPVEFRSVRVREVTPGAKQP